MSKLFDAVLEFEDAMRDNIKAHEEKHAQETAKLRERIGFLEMQLESANRVHFANRQDNEVKLTDFLQKNEALRAENAKLRDRITNLERETAEAWTAVREAQAENNADDARSDAIIEKLRVEMIHLREEYANRGAILQDFAKREHEHHQKIAELENLLRDIESMGRLTIATALQWKSNYEHQMAVNARQRSRIAELRLWLKRIANYAIADADVLRGKAKIALADDDRAAE